MAFELIGSKTRRVEVGRSFIAPKDSNVLHTANYSHEPKFNGKKGTMEIRQGSITMTIPGSGGQSQTFKGTKTGHTNKAVLIINKKTGKIVLERIGMDVSLQLQSPPMTFGQAYDRLKNSSSSDSGMSKKANIQPTSEKTVEPLLNSDHLKNMASTIETVENRTFPTMKVATGPSNKDGSLKRKDSMVTQPDPQPIKTKLEALFGNSPDVSHVSESSVKKLFTIEEDLQLTSDSDEDTSLNKSVNVPRHVEGTRTEAISGLDNGPKLPPVNAASVLDDDLDLSDSSDSESDSSDSSSSDSE